jgi:hypothetical protein
MWRKLLDFLIHSLVEPYLLLIKLRTATPENKIFVTDAAGEIVKINMEEPFIPMNMLNNCMQI